MKHFLRLPTIILAATMLFAGYVGSNETLTATITATTEDGGKTAECTVTEFTDIDIVINSTTGGLLWVLTKNGTLTISGNGAMPDYEMTKNPLSINTPWFPYRKAIETVVIVDSVKNIGNMAFYGCIGLTEITVKATVPPVVNRYIGISISTSIPVYVPSASLQAYKNADYWKNFTNLQGI